jgi:SSS family solute:Na+ symporter
VAWVALLLGSTIVVLAALGGDGGGAWSRDLFLVGIAGAFIAYTMVGGQAAVARSDLVQLGIMLAGAVALAVFALREAGGWEAIGGLGDHLSFPTSPGMGPGRVGAIVLVIGLPHVVGPDIYSKLLSARDDGTARKASLVAAAVKAAFAGLVAVVALCAVLVLPEGTGAYSVLPEMITSTLPPVAAGLVIAALVAAMMSSADSCLLTAGTVTAHDVWPALRDGPVGGREALLVARSATLAVGLLAMLLALVTTSLLDLLKLAYTVFASGLILPILAGFYRERTGITPMAATLAFMAGGGTGLVWNVLQMTVGWGTAVDAIAPGLLACGVTMVVARLILGAVPIDTAPPPGA